MKKTVTVHRGKVIRCPHCQSGDVTVVRIEKGQTVCICDDCDKGFVVKHK